jgi:NAD(P)-dependent dehydrogenase (short-subunit alcohol dehydrogenase family)
MQCLHTTEDACMHTCVLYLNAYFLLHSQLHCIHAYAPPLTPPVNHFNAYTHTRIHTLAQKRIHAYKRQAYEVAHHMMKTKKGGSIVFVSSRGARRGEPRALAYGASKAALNSLTGSLAQVNRREKGGLVLCAAAAAADKRVFLICFYWKV